MAEDFETVEVQHVHRENRGGPAWTVRGEDVYAIAFWSSLPAEAASSGSLGRSLSAVKALWPRPTSPIGFTDEDDFVSWLGRRDHLGAMAVLDPRLELDAQGRPLTVGFRRLASRWGRGFVNGLGSPTVVPEATDIGVTFAERGVRVAAHQRFVLPCPIDADGRWASGSMAALGWLSVTVDLRVDGASEVHLASSFLPSARFFRDGRLCARHEMSRCRPRELEAALTPAAEVPSGTTWRRFTSHGYVNAVR